MITKLSAKNIDLTSFDPADETTPGMMSSEDKSIINKFDLTDISSGDLLIVDNNLKIIKLPKGEPGQVLISDNSTTLGIKWAHLCLNVTMGE